VTLPINTKIKPFYDRTELIDKSIITLRDILIEMLIITMFTMWMFLLHKGATIVTSIAIISGVMLTFLAMKLLGIPSNIMSLGGIAIAIGTMVDSIIVVTENIYQKLLKLEKEKLAIFSERLKVVYTATSEVARPLFFAILIIMLSFVPIFALEGMEGKLFKPLAFTNIFAMLGALIVSLLFISLSCAYFLKSNLHTDQEIPVVFWFQKFYEPLLKKALNNTKKI